MMIREHARPMRSKDRQTDVAAVPFSSNDYCKNRSQIGFSRRVRNFQLMYTLLYVYTHSYVPTITHTVRNARSSGKNRSDPCTEKKNFFSFKPVFERTVRNYFEQINHAEH